MPCKLSYGEMYNIALCGSQCTSTALIVVGLCSLQQCLHTRKHFMKQFKSEHL